MRRILILSIFLTLILNQASFAQKENLGKYIEGISNTFTSTSTLKDIGGQVVTWQTKPVVILNEMPIFDFETLDQYTLSDLDKLVIDFDIKDAALYGSMARNGVIRIFLKEEKDKK
ncbi:hypothetical protein [Xanthovirga aplysinae]|uniref:hypothetical protein n=1 Tax=Xanthovirga aplysinae TaxID=2529853 RepID=UPI0012BB49BB|nr:hypothetical protein [Xanthovirga aplysinae]MTI33470.1 hypothetical protein [Xanthovirga aplysinae]